MQIAASVAPAAPAALGVVEREMTGAVPLQQVPALPVAPLALLGVVLAYLGGRAVFARRDT